MKIDKLLIVGGNFGDQPKKSSVIEKMRPKGHHDCINGGSLEDLKKIDLSPYNFIIWMPNISNDEEKWYPKKPLGAVMIISKVLHEGVTELDAISRIFKMGANAVITINKEEPIFKFKVIDALGNCWGITDNPDSLFSIIWGIYGCYGSSKRVGSQVISGEIPRDCAVSSDLKLFMKLNRHVADRASSMGGRYFGNCSTRCDSLFPTVRVNTERFLVSPRNIDKGIIEVEDMVLVEVGPGRKFQFYGDKKPSIDTPVQLLLYEEAERINYMIHGHYYIYGAPFTQNFYPCGDTREYKELANIIGETYSRYAMGAINLKNHGFFLYSSNIEEMRELISRSIFVRRDIGNEPIYWSHTDYYDLH